MVEKGLGSLIWFGANLIRYLGRGSGSRGGCIIFDFSSKTCEDTASPGLLLCLSPFMSTLNIRFRREPGGPRPLNWSRAIDVKQAPDQLIMGGSNSCDCESAPGGLPRVQSVLYV